MSCSLDAPPENGFDGVFYPEDQMPDLNADIANELRGKLMLSELLNFSLLAILTADRPDRAEVIHNVIGAVDSMLDALPDDDEAGRATRIWARAWWKNLSPTMAGLIHIDPKRGLFPQ